MKQYLFLIVCIFFFKTNAYTIPTLSEKAEISILTCAPGTSQLYTAFGHSGIRVKDPILGIDWAYNYGTFDFDTPNFYLKFCQGHLLYKLSKYDFKYFPYPYYREQQRVVAQVLNLNQTDKQRFFESIETNARPENAQYYYDFFYDNCATIMIDQIEKNIPQAHLNFSALPNNKTLRNLLHNYLQEMPWARFGIDLALGSKIDQPISKKTYTFLPDYVFKTLQQSSIGNLPMVKSEKAILDYPTKNRIFTTNTPLHVTISILILVVLMHFLSQKWSKVVNTLVLTFCGLTGIILCLLWFATEHHPTVNNFNVLWANPLILLVFPFIKQKKAGFLLLFSILLITIPTSIFGWQSFNIAFYPIMLSLGWIYGAKLFKA